MDKLYHFLLCLAATFAFGWKIGLTVGLTVEATQIEGYWRKSGIRSLLRYYWWSDTFLDLIFDAAGIAIGMILRRLLLGYTP